MNLSFALLWIFLGYLAGLVTQALAPQSWPVAGKILVGTGVVLALLLLSTFFHRSTLS